MTIRKALVVSKTAPVGFNLVPKVASTSIVWALMQADGIQCERDPKAIHEMKWLRLTVPEFPKGIFRVAFVRNPFDRLVSVWRNKVSDPHTHLGQRYKGCSFGQFVSKLEQDGLSVDPHVRPQCEFIFEGEELQVDFLGRFERLNEDWQYFQSRFGVPDLEVFNESGPSSSRKEYYSGRADLAERVGNLYSRDLRRLGYSFYG